MRDGSHIPEPPKPPKSRIPTLFLWGSLVAIAIAMAYILLRAP